MNVSKLFGVLVVGGSLLVSGGCETTDRNDERDNVETGPDAAEEVEESVDAQANSADAEPLGELAPCFCNSEACCERHEDGTGTLQEGFECCWSTTC